MKTHLKIESKESNLFGRTFARPFTRFQALEAGELSGVLAIEAETTKEPRRHGTGARLWPTHTRMPVE